MLLIFSRYTPTSFHSGLENSVRKGYSRCGCLLNCEGSQHRRFWQEFLRWICNWKHLHSMAGRDDWDWCFCWAQCVGSQWWFAKRLEERINSGASSRQVRSVLHCLKMQRTRLRFLCLWLKHSAWTIKGCFKIQVLWLYKNIMHLSSCSSVVKSFAWDSSKLSTSTSGPTGRWLSWSGSTRLYYKIVTIVNVFMLDT